MEDRDADRAEYVRKYLERPGFRLGGTDLRVFSAMGDSVAAAILAWLDPARLREETFLQKIIAAVCVSFEHPGNIENDANRIPLKSLDLLRTLIADVESEDQKSRIKVALESLEKKAP